MRREIYGGFGLAPVSAEVDFRVQAPEWSRAQLYYSQDYNVNEASRVVNDNINQMHYEFVAPLSAFLGILDYCSQAVGDSGYGRVNTIGHVGIKRFAAGVPSYHYAWKAIDLSYVHWEGGNISRPHSALKDVVVGGTGSSQAHRRLIAVEACLRSAFGYVLNRYIGRLSRPYGTTNAEGPNSEHFNHFHADNGCPVALIADRRNLANPTLGKRTVRSGHYFIQDCINAFTDRQIDYDGRWGAKTELGYLTLLRDMGMERLDPISYVSHYLLFLDFIIVHGLTDSRSGAYRWRDNPIEGGQSKWPL
ncbi:MAG: hypothetical protein F4005_01755 [Acidimicrobiales bacterium]|nr:hypothetical protein [Acidimicrobiales bacterium]MYA83374.1 hypothetical protein [Acidimicrobiales bacterium]MYK71033.1 hypothetical protein [Acidimicrobiales bacterium]